MQVVRCAEQCAAAMAVCPFEVVVGVLNPLITTAEYPMNLAAIKMMTKLVEHHGTEICDEHLKDVMPRLIQVLHLLQTLQFIIIRSILKTFLDI